MRNILLLISFILLSSCSITERLLVLPDDQVKISHEIDLSQMLIMVKSVGGNENSPLSKQKKQDTLIRFKSFLDEKKDSISLLPLDEQNKLKILEKYNMKMVMNEEDDQLIMTLFADFDNIKDINQVMNFGEVLEKSNVNLTGGKDLPKNLSKLPSKTTFVYIDDTFKRQTIFEKTKVSEDSEESFDPENPTPDQILEMVKELPVTMIYKISYRFAKRIRATNVKNAKISADRLNIDFEFDMKTYETDPEYLNLEIYFE